MDAYLGCTFHRHFFTQISNDHHRLGYLNGWHLSLKFMSYETIEMFALYNIFISLNFPIYTTAFVFCFHSIAELLVQHPTHIFSSLYFINFPFLVFKVELNEFFYLERSAASIETKIIIVISNLRNSQFRHIGKIVSRTKRKPKVCWCHLPNLFRVFTQSKSFPTNNLTACRTRID